MEPYQDDELPIKLLKAVYRIRKYQEKPSIANQGQCLDGYSSLANYNNIADKIKIFLDILDTKTKSKKRGKHGISR